MEFKNSRFPLLVLFLTLLLLGFMIFTFVKKDSTPNESVTPVVSEKEYKTQMAMVVNNFLPSYLAATDDVGRRAVVDSTLTKLLEIRVPANQKDLHLELAISLNLILTQLSGTTDVAREGLERWKKAVSGMTSL